MHVYFSPKYLPWYVEIKHMLKKENCGGAKRDGRTNRISSSSSGGELVEIVETFLLYRLKG